MTRELNKSLCDRVRFRVGSGYQLDDLLDTADEIYLNDPYYEVCHSTDEVLIESVLGRRVDTTNTDCERSYDVRFLLGFLEYTNKHNKEALDMCARVAIKLKRWLLIECLCCSDIFSWVIASSLLSHCDDNSIAVTKGYIFSSGITRAVERLNYLINGDV